MYPYRYEQRATIAIDAPIERVYAIATHPERVPRYAAEITRIKTVRTHPHGARDVQSFITILGITIPFHYRYRYRPPHFYGGVQRKGAPVRGGFSMRFRALDARTTEVEHVEAIISRNRWISLLAGWMWFGLLAPDGPEGELRCLKRLVEGTRDERRARPSWSALA